MRFNNIQFLRFVAVFLVLASHSVIQVWERLGISGQYGYWNRIGGTGVDMFFVISGFVIILSAQKLVLSGGAGASWQFIKRRIIRIVPMYWIYTALKAVVIIAIGSKIFHSTVAPDYFLRSLFFVPSVHPTGQILPLLESGWTLSFEMLFYSAFALAIMFRMPPLRFCLAVLTFIFCMGLIFKEQVIPAFFGRSLIYEFLLGGLIAHAWVRRIVLPAMIALPLLCVAIMMLFIVPELPIDRFFSLGVPSAVLVMVMTWAERYHWLSKISAHFKLLGDASYSTYLSHGLTMPVCAAIGLKIGLNSIPTLFAFTMIGALSAGCVLYICIERPVTAWLNGRYASPVILPVAFA